PDCPRRVSYAIRLPVEAFRDALTARHPQWPPPDLDHIRVHVQVLGPGDATPLFDSNAPGALAPASLSDLARPLQPGAGRPLTRQGEPREAPLVLKARDDAAARTSPLILRLIDRLPVTERPAPLQGKDVIATSLASYDARFTGDARGIDRSLGVIATRL